MKKALLLITLIILSAMAFAQTAPNWTWAKGSGSTGDDRGTAIATDSNGNTYVTGSYKYQALFGTTILFGGGGDDIFVAKIDPSGFWVWAVRASGSSSDFANGIYVDGNNDIYITGSFSSNAYFGPFYLSSAGQNDVFVAKLNSDGVWQWAKRAGGTRIDVGYDVCTDTSGNTFITGFFSGTAVFGSTTLVAGVQDEIFVSKLDSSGNWLWAKRAGSSGYDYGYGISTDLGGNCYVSGCFDGSANFGTIALSGSGYYDAYVAKIDTSGNWIWARNAGGMDNDYSYGSVTDSSDNTYLVGSFTDSATFGSITLTSNSYDDIFVAKIASDGTWLWVKNAGGDGYDYGQGVALDSAENCYITGFFESSAYFGDTTLSASGVTDAFAAKLDYTGNWIWARNAGGIPGMSETEGSGIAADAEGSCYVTGKFTNTAYFDTFPVYNYGGSDIFVAKLSFETIGSGVPLPPQNVVLTTNGWDLFFSWDPVTEDTDGQPVTPDYYQIDYATDPYGDFTPLVQVGSTDWTSYGAAWQSPCFYRVIAVVEDK